LSDLLVVELAHTKVGDEAAKVLAGYPKIFYLDLEDTQVTDACVPHVLKLKKLEFLDVRGTKLTAKGVAALDKGLKGRIDSDYK
jgi:hypothetical protein